jgi:hypothetical protein
MIEDRTCLTLIVLCERVIKTSCHHKECLRPVDF